MARLCRATEMSVSNEHKANSLGSGDDGGEFLPGAPNIWTSSDTKEKRLKCIFGFMVSYSCRTESPSITAT